MTVDEFLVASLTKIAEITEINKGTLSKYFSPVTPDNPSWKSISKMSEKLGMTAETLMQAIELKRVKNYRKLKAKVSKTKLVLS